MIIDFDLRLKEKLFISKPSTKTSAGELQILTENNNIFFIPVRKNFCKNSKINDFLLKKDGLLTLIELMKKEFPKS